LSFPRPEAGHVIRYAYLWKSEFQRGQEEGLKDRPCAIVLSVVNDGGSNVVVVLPITHTPPTHPDDAIEIPTSTKLRLGLDSERSWIVITEANRFAWPGPDLRPNRRGDADSVLYGSLPRSFFYKVREKFLNSARMRKTSLIPRSE
jgi:hypothetical protein